MSGLLTVHYVKSAVDKSYLYPVLMWWCFNGVLEAVFRTVGECNTAAS